ADHEIPYRRFDHAPVFTCEETEREISAEAEGVQTKNLFLRDKRGKRHWLVVTSCEKSPDLRALAPHIGADHLSLASAERLERHLGVTPGSVTVLALINDGAHAVELWVDHDVWHASAWRCHPMVNSATLVIARSEIDRFLAATGHEARVVRVPERR
ncbi:MAG TPA: prolyl-tRNA synthetase associated domain-containing protein, partial [Gemmatimonadaceae bacterium]|nr:prolyl-tRNA synthetase associated domain-containing protein [Gemmatimonadaceae bacterium]